MKRFSIARHLVLLATLALSGALGGCIAQAPGPDDHSQTDNEPRQAELMRMDAVDAPAVARSQASLAISTATPLGGSAAGPQPEPWQGADGDPNGGPQPEPWKPHKIAPEDPNEAPEFASGPKP